MSAYSKLLRMKRTLLRVSETRYPRFIFGLSPARNEIPIFTYHDVEYEDFDSDLTYLHENGYRTLTIDEYFYSVSFMSWQQVRECAASGRVDVHSHAHRHALVYTSNQLVEFVSPDLLSKFDMYDWPMRHAQGTDFLGYPQLGTPVYEAMPLLSATYRMIENENVSNLCLEAVEENGGNEFFTHPKPAEPEPNRMK
jgi:hypothetical protein